MQGMPQCESLPGYTPTNWVIMTGLPSINLMPVTGSSRTYTSQGYSRVLWYSAYVVSSTHVLATPERVTPARRARELEEIWSRVACRDSVLHRPVDTSSKGRWGRWCGESKGKVV